MTQKRAKAFRPNFLTGHPTRLWAGSTLNPSAPCDLSGADPDLKRQTAVVTNDFGWKVKETDPLGHV
ncbi:MAG: hypothetical protein K0M39_14965, partial [Rhizobium sp.]|nr:hypothetical protein [Rhizobium sp.]